MIKQGDWVTIKYGEYAGCYGKIYTQKKSGEYGVLPYRGQLEGDALFMLGESIEKIEPATITRKELKDLLCFEIKYEEIADRVFPPFNVKVDRAYALSVDDIRQALMNINKIKHPLPEFKKWFWLIINVFYDKLKIRERYTEDETFDFPANEREIFSTVYGMVEKLYWHLEERLGKKEDDEKFFVKFDNEPHWDDIKPDNLELEEQAYYIVCEDVIGRVDSYNFNKDKPQGQWVYSRGQMKHVIGAYNSDEDLKGTTPEAKALYKDFVKKLYRMGDIQALKILAWSHYTGNALYRQNWNKSKKFLTELYESTGDPEAANALGYIAYYGRCNNGEPEYEEAFRFFSYGAIAGIDESLYKSADMLIKGQGTNKNIDMGINIIIDGYRETMEEICSEMFDSKFADYAVRMGNCCRDGLLYGMGPRDAYRFYLEAKFALEKRKKFKFYGDESVLERVNTELKNIAEPLGIDTDLKELKADFPIFLNQLFEDKYPVRVSVSKKKNGEKKLKVQNFRLSEMFDLEILGEAAEKIKSTLEPKILVTYPELSYTNLVSSLEYCLEEVSVLELKTKAVSFLCDGFKRNDKTGAIEFYSNGELVAAIDAKWYVIKVKK